MLIGRDAELERLAAWVGEKRLAPGRAGRDRQTRSVAWWLAAEVGWLDGRLNDAIDAAGEAVALSVGDYPSAVLARLIGGHATRELGADHLEGPSPGPLLRAWSGASPEWQALAAAAAQSHDEAAERFDEAADAWRGHDLRSEARCRWAAADEARLAGADDAVSRLRAAVELADQRRLGPLAARGRRSLRAAGVTSRARSAPGRGGLTAREEEVLRLVGSGRSSPEIAAALGIKVSTVESFVRSATRKLGAPSRLAAAARLQALDQASR